MSSSGTSCSGWCWWHTTLLSVLTFISTSSERKCFLTVWSQVRNTKKCPGGKINRITQMVKESSGVGGGIILLIILFFFFSLRFYLFMRDTERGRDTGRGRNRLPEGSLMQDLIPGLQDYALSRRQMLNHWATQATLEPFFLMAYLECSFVRASQVSESSLNVERPGWWLSMELPEDSWCQENPWCIVSVHWALCALFRRCYAQCQIPELAQKQIHLLKRGCCQAGSLRILRDKADSETSCIMVKPKAKHTSRFRELPRTTGHLK